MKNKTSIYTLLILGFLINSCVKHKNETPKMFHKEIDTYINSIIKADKIPGIAVAVIKKGQIIHKKNYGLANIPHNVPVTDSTLFRAYSTTKLITAVAVFQLIEAKKIDLKDPISKYIDQLPLLWKDIKIEHLLTHSSGLPEYKDFDTSMPDQTLISKMVSMPLLFEKGNKFEYNQTNFWFLQQIIEKVSNQKFDDFVIKNQFNSTYPVVFASNSLTAIPNRVAKYQFNKEHNTYEMTTYNAGERSIAGNGLNVNLNALIDWNTRFDNNQLLQNESKLKMLTPFKFKNDNTPFGYSWGIFGPEGKKYYGFAGGGVSALMKFIDNDLTIIILSNGFKNNPIISNAITYISGLSDSSLIRKDRMLNEDIRLAFLLTPYKEAFKKYKQIKNENQKVNFERALNGLGYYYLNHNEIEKSITILKLYTEEYPNSYNAFDSLAEAYFTQKKYNLATKNYLKSLELYPDNKNAKKMLAKIKQLYE
ncbi:serine hydrolase [Tenacibaculum sp. 190524A02b]|uniref:serine hydrolase n=1 Tax=Tenacibaculum vairaonense TaxID=3137860 RepID=UPI0031FAD938